MMTPEKILKWDFGAFEPARKRKYLRIEIAFDQNQLATTLIRALRNQIGPEKPIIDLRGLDSFAPELEERSS
jgi:hypothetical protein